MTVKWRIGKYLLPLTKVVEDKRILFSFRYNKAIIAEIKSMAGAKWNADHKIWSVTNNARNRFNIAWLEGVNVFSDFDKPIPSVVSLLF